MKVLRAFYEPWTVVEILLIIDFKYMKAETLFQIWSSVVIGISTQQYLLYGS